MRLGVLSFAPGAGYQENEEAPRAGMAASTGLAGYTQLGGRANQPDMDQIEEWLTHRD